MTEFIESPPGIKRRTVVKTAAWSVPVIAAAMAVPVAAASACVEGQRRSSFTLRWNGGQYQRAADGRGGSGTVFDSCGNIVTIVTINSTFGSKAEPNAGTAAGNAQDVGGPNLSARDAGLRISNRRTEGAPNAWDADFAQTVTLTFTPAVQNLRFDVLDIDREDTDYIERVLVNAPAFAVGGANLDQQLPVGDYIANVQGNSAVTAPAHTVQCNQPGTVNSASFQFVTTGPRAGTSGVVLSNLHFEAFVPCDCD